MRYLTIEYKYGGVQKFKERGTVRYETGFIVITDEKGNETAICSEGIAEIRQQKVP